jgi:hypothetical protein
VHNLKLDEGVFYIFFSLQIQVELFTKPKLHDDVEDGFSSQ